MKRRPDRGFTLIEVLVALAIAGSAMVLILAANQTSTRRSLAARNAARLERAAETKLAEWSAGIETALKGPLAGFDGYRWEIVVSAAELSCPKRLTSVTIVVRSPDGTRLLERTRFEYARSEGR